MTLSYITTTDEEQWLDLRRRNINSTESSALFGLSPYATAYEMWHRKNGTLTDDFQDNERVQAGRHIEAAIASIVSERYGVSTEPLKSYATDDDARMGSSFDYKITGHTPMAGDGFIHLITELREYFDRLGAGILECKNVDFLVHRDRWTEDECPDHIEIQLQHQLEITGMPWGVIAALVGGNKIWLYIRERDRAVGRGLRKRIAEFWKSIDDGIEPPPVMPDDADAVMELYQYAEDGKVFSALGDDTFSWKLGEYERLGKEIAAADEARKVIKAEMLMVVGDAEKVVADNGKLSLGQVKPCHVSYDRAGYRMFRFTPKRIPK